MRKQILLAATLLAGAAGVAVAQNAATYDPSQLPAIQGKVAEYSLTPRGDVDGLILADGTEAHLPPHLGTQLVYAVKPGDAVTIRGLKARAIPMVQAMSVKNDATGSTVTDNGAGGPPGPADAQQPLSATGRIKAQLHGPRGDLNGALLEDGTIIRLPPPEAERLAAMLAVGARITVKGFGLDGPLGRVIEARSIGADATHLAQVAAPPRPGPGRRPPPPPGGPGMVPPPGPPPPPG
ncbi:hypothetical protein [Rhodopila sp.]|uniref:hypothetical protein n=1 Tax=Rhodopila sp. TaxID=2480087 RepID=UPI003D0D4919